MLLPLSARDPEALAELAGRYAAVLAGPGAPHAVDVCHTAAHDADLHEHRIAVVGTTAAELSEGLTSALRREPARGVATGRVPPGARSPVVFVFAGQGPQWCGMGRDLLASEPVFADAIEACDAAMRPHAPWRLLDEFVAGEERTRLEQTEIAQPLLFALQVGLAALWREWGVEPAAVIGHSHGEIAAAHFAGVLDLVTAARMIVTRGRLMQAATGTGGMAALTMDARDAEELAAASRGLLSVAALNGPRSVVLSGDSDALDDALASLGARGIGNTRLPVNSARHSAQMEAVRDEMERALGAVQRDTGTIPFYSTVTGSALDGRAMDAAYWARNVRETVRFAPAVQAAAARGGRTFLEISPSPTLLWHIEESLAPFGGVRVAASLRRGRPGRSALLVGAGELYAAGVSLRWGKIQSGGRRIDLPLAANRPRAAVAAPPSTRLDYSSFEPDVRHATIARVVRDQVAAILELPPSAQFDPAQNFFAAGMDSLMAVDLKSRLERAILPSLPANLTFVCPSANALVDYLTNEVAARGTLDGPRTHSSPASAPIRLLSRDADLPLSFGQERVWFLEQLQPESLAYNSLRRVRLSGELDPGLLRRCVEAIVARHEVLRASFPEVNGVPVQRIAQPGPWIMPILDLRSLPEPAREDEARRLTRAEVKTPFDLATGPLLRTLLLRLTDDTHVLVLTIHHIVSDEWSTDIFLRELAAFHDAFHSGTVPELAELPIQHADFAQWQREWLTGDVYESNRAYWAGKLAGPLPILELPGERRPPAEAVHEARTHHSSVDATVLHGLRELSMREGVTLYTTLLAALSVLLHRYAGQDDIIVGTYVAGRMRGEVDLLIGFFVNTLALRTDLSGDPTFREALLRTRDVVLAGQAHADFPYEKLVEELHPERNLTRNPFFQVDFNLHGHRARADRTASGLRIESLPYLDYHATTDGLTITAFDHKDALDFAFIHDPRLFDGPTIARLDAHFGVVLAGIVADPEARLSALPLVTPVERVSLLADFVGTVTELPTAASFSAYFEQEVARTPGAIAIHDEEGTCTYGELNARANQIARTLVAAGVAADVPVALFVSRGRALVTWIIATFKAGGVYVPLDPQQPVGRHASILEQSRAAVVVVADEFRLRLDAAVAGLSADTRPRVFRASELAADTGECTDLPARAQPDDLAYIIFTSGSTGLPKGAMIPHRAMLNNFWSAIRTLEITRADVIAQTAPPGFDMSVWQLLAGLLVGARVRIAPDAATSEPVRLFALVERDGITIADVVPSVLRAYLDETPAQPGFAAFGALRWLLVGGEALPTRCARDWLTRHPNVPLVNAYGPTECADVVTRQILRAAPDDATQLEPIGRPIDNARVYIVDRHQSPAPLGVAGELCVGGVCVGRGYVNDPERTAAAFVADPFSAAAGARMYRTGDRARFRADGTIEFLGRTDHQVKIRGHRIELGDIESVIARHPSVRECVVSVRDGAQGPRLVAYLVGVEPSSVTEGEELRIHIRSALPGYMMPDAFVVLATLPLNANGKLDRKALPAPESPQPSATTLPRTDAERTVAGVWAEALGVERVGIHDNFFALGGHSLIATRVVARLREAFGVDLPLRRLFELQTVVELAASLASDAISTPGGTRPTAEGNTGPVVRRASREAYRRVLRPDSDGEPE